MTDLEKVATGVMKTWNPLLSVWYHRYQPSHTEDMILPPQIKKKLNRDVESEDLKHYGLFSSSGGTGKSSLANALVRQLGGEALWVNASVDRSIDLIKKDGRLAKFAGQQSFDGKKKIIVMDEFDNCLGDLQSGFRGFIDMYGRNCIFIFTGNHIEKIIPQLLERMEVYEFEQFTKTDMVRPIYDRLSWILNNENVEFEQKDIITIINNGYPSIRNMIGNLQRFSNDGKLTFLESELDSSDAYDKIINLLSPQHYFAMIQEVNKLSSPNNMYSFLYKNADRLFPTKNYPLIIVLISKYEYQSSQSRDKHLQLSSCLSEIMNYSK